MPVQHKGTAEGEGHAGAEEQRRERAILTDNGRG